MRKIMEELEDCPVIAAVKDEKGLEECLNMDVGMVFDSIWNGMYDR